MAGGRARCLLLAFAVLGRALDVADYPDYAEPEPEPLDYKDPCKAGADKGAGRRGLLRARPQLGAGREGN